MQSNFSNARFFSLCRFFIMVISLSSSLYINAQKTRKLSYYNLQILEKANEYYDLGDYYSALTNYQKIDHKAPGDTFVNLRIAESYKMLNRFDLSEIAYSKILDNDQGESMDAIHFLNYAQVLTINGKYNKALHWYKKYYLLNSRDSRGEAGIQTIENIDELYYDTIFYTVFPTEVNTIYDEYSPVYYENGVVFVSDRKKENVGSSSKGSKPGYTNWYFSSLVNDEKLGTPVQFNKELNFKTSFNEGPLVFYDNDRKTIFTQNGLVENKVKDDLTVLPVQLFYSQKEDKDNWSDIEMLNFCDNSSSFGQPAITSDGKTLIFSSNMPGGYGGSDLYMSRFEQNAWQKPENLGSIINTLGDEMFPYILDDSVLYFSSDGHGGLGGLDIFYLSLNQREKIEKIGLPVNSPYDDFGIIVSKDHMSGFFSSNRTGQMGNDDIYAFRIIRISLALKIMDGLTSSPISNADVISVSGADESKVGKTDENGYCKVILPVSQEIKIRVKKENFESQVFTYEPVMYKIESNQVLFVNNEKKEKPVVEKQETPEPETEDVIYKVQIMASRRAAMNWQLKRKYKGNMPINKSNEDNWHKYTIGEFKTISEACDCLISSHVEDAFLVAYKNNIRDLSIFLNSHHLKEIEACNELRMKSAP
jgi:hypothetical protein